MSLRDIFCQDRAIGILQRGLAVDRSAHAYIFAGLEGVGKYKTAREWAKLLLCRNPQTKRGSAGPFADNCGACESCTLLEAGSHPDYAHVYKELVTYTKDGKDKKTPIDLPIDVVREFLIEQVAIRPALSHRKVFVISEAEKLNVNSQNALLKVLEEPPSYCTIILLCTRLEQLLPTTRSRCQILRFGPVEEERIVALLTGMGLGPKEATLFARLAQGSLGLACQWARLEQNGAGLFAIKKSIVASLADYKMIDALALAEQILEYAKQIATGWAELDKATSKSDLTRRANKTLIQIILAALRDVTIVHLAAERPLIHADQAEQIAKLARRLDPEQAMDAVTEGYEMLRWLEDNVNEKLIFERLLLRLARSTIMITQG
jgi:DNA polymerase III subunit delta'